MSWSVTNRDQLPLRPLSLARFGYNEQPKCVDAISLGSCCRASIVSYSSRSKVADAVAERGRQVVKTVENSQIVRVVTVTVRCVEKRR